MAAGLVMARCREPSTGSLGSCSAMTGDDEEEEQHNAVHVVVPGASVHLGGTWKALNSRGLRFRKPELCCES